MPIVAAYITPHPPLIFPEIGRGQEKAIQNTIDSMEKIAYEIEKIQPDTVIVISPHSIMYSDYIHISPGSNASGDMAQFNAQDINIHVEYDEKIVKQLEEVSEQNGIPAGTLGEKDSDLDHGTVIPLKFLNDKYDNYKVVRIAPAGISYDELYNFGRVIQEVSQDLNKKVVIIASGDLSHKLKDDGPYGFAPEGPRFDKQITDAIETGDFSKFLHIEPSFAEKAADCGLRGFIIMAGALDETSVDSQLLSYEGPFGVGYGVGSIKPTGHDSSRAFVKEYLKVQAKKIDRKRENENQYVKLARRTVECLSRFNKEYKPDFNLPETMTKKQAGVFVSIKKDGELRGCIGTIAPTRDSIAQEIIKNAISASSEDPRFPSISEYELERLTYSVDVLGEPESIDDVSQLDTQRYGVIVSFGAKRGLLLPNLDGIDNVDQQIEVAMNKADIPLNYRDEINLQRFEVIRYD